MRSALFISLSVHVLVTILAFNWVRFRRVDYVPRPVYNVTLVTHMLEPAPAKAVEQPENAQPEAAPPEPEPEPEEMVVPQKPKPRKKKPKPKPRKIVPTTEVEKTKPPPEAAAEEPPAETGQMTLDTDDFPFAYYIGRMRRKIAANWRVPGGSQGAERMCRVYFRVYRDGRVDNVAVEESSGLFLFDQSAERSVVRSAPFPPLPREYADDYLGVHFTFAFRSAR